MSPHGDGRWSIRLSQIIGARAVPLLVADALTLPCEHTALVGPRSYVSGMTLIAPPPFAPLPRRYEQLVDWRYVALWWTEGDVAAARAARLLAAARRLAAAALRRQNVCRVPTAVQ